MRLTIALHIDNNEGGGLRAERAIVREVVRLGTYKCLV